MAEFIDPGMLRTELIVEDAIESGDGAGGVVRMLSLIHI